MLQELPEFIGFWGLWLWLCMGIWFCMWFWVCIGIWFCWVCIGCCIGCWFIWGLGFEFPAYKRVLNFINFKPISWKSWISFDRIEKNFWPFSLIIGHSHDCLMMSSMRNSSDRQEGKKFHFGLRVFNRNQRAIAIWSILVFRIWWKLWLLFGLYTPYHIDFDNISKQYTFFWRCRYNGQV